MHSDGRKRSSAFLALRFAPLCTTLVFAVGLSARPAEAGPFAYVVNTYDNTVSVIDAVSNNVVATVLVGSQPGGVAVAPDGKHAYVTYVGGGFDAVAVIDTASNKVVATIPVGAFPFGIAITPDGQHAYVANRLANNVSVIDVVSNKVVATVPVGETPRGIAVTPDGKHAYVTNLNSLTVSVIDTVSNKVVATVPVAVTPAEVAITPDGKHAYVTGNDAVTEIDTATKTVVATVPVLSFALGIAITPDGKHAYAVSDCGRAGTLSVIDTATNTVVATVPVGPFAYGVAITPDGMHAYVVNGGAVSAIDTAINKVVATIPVGVAPLTVGIMPPPRGVPFSAFRAKLEIHFGQKPNTDAFNLKASFTLGSASNGINPPVEAVILQVGTFSTTIPPGSFKGVGFGPFHFERVINGVHLEVGIEPTGAKRYAFHAKAHDANLTGTVNPVPLTLAVGDDSLPTSVDAKISGRD